MTLPGLLSFARWRQFDAIQGQSFFSRKFELTLVVMPIMIEYNMQLLLEAIKIFFSFPLRHEKKNSWLSIRENELLSFAIGIVSFRYCGPCGGCNAVLLVTYTGLPYVWIWYLKSMSCCFVALHQIPASFFLMHHRTEMSLPSSTGTKVIQTLCSSGKISCWAVDITGASGYVVVAVKLLRHKLIPQHITILCSRKQKGPPFYYLNNSVKNNRFP